MNFLTNRHILPALIVCILLEGCTGYSTSFDCPIGEGLKCTSLSEVNRRMDAGDLQLEGVAEGAQVEDTESRPLSFWKKTSKEEKEVVSSLSSCPSCQRIYWRTQKGKKL